MTLGQHLVELRNRFFKAALGIVLGAVIGWFLYDPVFAGLRLPVEGLAERGYSAELNFDQVGSSFDMKIRISVWLGFIISSPIWLYQFWAFITPGLTRRERGYSLLFVGVGIPLFGAGVTMAWYALPGMVVLLVQFTPEGVVNLMSASEYLRFVMQFLVIFGVAFLLPLVMVTLNFASLVTGRTWLRHWRWAVIVIFVITALATPGGEVTTFLLMGAPIVLLYVLAVGICLLNDRRRARRVDSSSGTGESTEQENPHDEIAASGGHEA